MAKKLMRVEITEHGDARIASVLVRGGEVTFDQKIAMTVLADRLEKRLPGIGKRVGFFEYAIDEYGILDIGDRAPDPKVELMT